METAPQAPPALVSCQEFVLRGNWSGLAPFSREPAADVASSLGLHGDNVGALLGARAEEMPAMLDCQRLRG